MSIFDIRYLHSVCPNEIALLAVSILIIYKTKGTHGQKHESNTSTWMIHFKKDRTPTIKGRG